jgi:sugar O-acyltransferase (sialic acid O-acetyltransferase NeuD family)
MCGLLVVGAGGHGKVVADIARESGRWDRIAFLDDKYPFLAKVGDWDVIGVISDTGRFLKEFPEAVVAIGANRLRLDVMTRMMKEGFQFPVLVHPDASVSRSTSIGAGSVICAQAAVIIGSSIGICSIVNTGASVGHDCQVGSGVHIAPGVRLAGGVSIGECSWVGIGAVVKEGLSIGNGVVVGAGTTLIKDVPDDVTVVGSPGRIIRENNLEGLPESLEFRFRGFLQPDDPRWGEALGKTTHDFFHLPGYVSACGPHEGGEPLLFLLDLGHSGMLVPLIRRSLKEFGAEFSEYSDASSPYGYPGPLYWGDGWQNRLPEMHAAFEAFLRSEKVVSLFLRLNPFVGPSEEMLSPLGGVNTHGPTVFINLRDAEGSWMGINSANRAFISRMLRRGFEVRIDQWDTTDQIIEAYFETMHRLNASPFYFFPNSFFYELHQANPDNFHLATAYAPTGEVMGGCFFSEVGGLIQYFLMGALEAHMEASPSKLLINALRLWGLEHGHHTLNLGGGLGARRDGLFEFKVRLSKQVATYSTFRKILLPEVHDALARSRGIEVSEDDYFPIYRKSRTTLVDIV